MNSNNPMRGMGVPPSFGGLGGVAQSIPMNHQSPQIGTHLQSQSHGSVLYQVSEARPQAFGQGQMQAHTHAQGGHGQFQTQTHSINQSFVQPQNPGMGGVGLSSSSPSTVSAKKASHKPPSRPSGSSSNPNTSSPFKTMELTPAAIRKKRKLPENRIPDKVAAVLPESALYTHLLEFEARIDSAMSRKKMEIQEAIKNPPRVRKTLRLYVYNTFENQKEGTHENKNADSPSWSLKITGRLLEDGKDPMLFGMPQKSYPKFSSYFKKMTIYLDQSLYPDNHVILWESARSPVLNDGFEVKRNGDKEFTAMIRLEMNYVPDKFKLSPALSEVLGIEVDTRSRILVALWQYVKAKKLQNHGDPSFFTCDPPLQRLFGEEKMKFSTVSQKISQHLIAPQPIHLEHRIKLSGNCPAGTACYDIAVEVPFPLQRDLANILANTDSQKEIDTHDKTINDAVKKLHEHHRRRAFFLGFSQSPAEFIDALISSQSKDLKLMAGDASRNADQQRHSEFYNQPWVEDAVIRYLNRKAAGTDAPGST